MPGIRGISRDSVSYVVLVALGVCLVCSILVSAAAVYLKPMQTANALADRRKNILEVADLMAPGIDINAVFRERIETRVVDLASGEYVDVDPESFDQREAASDPERSVAIPKGQDPAGIKRRAKYAEVYLVRDEGGELRTLVLPIHGYGLWSTMYGFLAVEPDGNTVAGLNFYQHGETPGLGAEIANPKWRALWRGKEIYDVDGDVRLRVVKGAVAPGSANAEFRVDGLSGATLTSRGVSGTVEYWFGERGYKRYLQNVSEGKFERG